MRFDAVAATRSHSQTAVTVQRPHDLATASRHDLPARIWRLQQTHGNSYVRRLLAQEDRGSRPSTATPEAGSTMEPAGASGSSPALRAADAFAPLGADVDPNIGDAAAGPVGDETAPIDGGPAAPAAVCAQPINFALGTASNTGPDAIFIPISWSSSTGRLADLTSCTIREVVNYDAIPNPPFTWTPPNPTILSVAGSLGSAGDTHSYPPGLASIPTPKVGGTMTAHQVYQFQCTGPGCSGTWTNLPNQAYTITRRIFPEPARPDAWRYRITKTGVGHAFSGSREVAVP